MSVMSDAFPRQQDERIRQDVIRQIGWCPEIRSRDVSVKVQDAGVVLTGFVHTYLEKRAAENAAKSVFGVLSVANDVEVRPATKRTDPEIARDVIDALRIHSAVPHDKIKVLVHDGFVTLEGMVTWDFERRCATRIAGEVIGVKSVVDTISLMPSVSPTDVKEKIEEAWKRTFDLDARRMLVTTEGGAVSLWGTVHSWSEREEAEHAAWQAPGVQRVANHIAVQV